MDKEHENYVADTFREIAKSFNTTRRTPWPEVVSFINMLADFGKKLKVLDAGTGNGYNANYALKSGIDVICLDLVFEMLLVAKKNIGPGHYVCGDIRKLPFRDDTFDGLFSVAVIHHLPVNDAVKALDEFSRVTKPSSPIFISVWKREQEKLLKYTDENGDALIPWSRDGIKKNRFYHLYKKDEFQEIIENSKLGLKKIKEDRGNYFALCETRC